MFGSTHNRNKQYWLNKNIKTTCGNPTATDLASDLVWNMKNLPIMGG